MKISYSYLVENLRATTSLGPLEGNSCWNWIRLIKDKTGRYCLLPPPPPQHGNDLRESCHNPLTLGIGRKFSGNFGLWRWHTKKPRCWVIRRQLIRSRWFWRSFEFLGEAIQLFKCLVNLRRCQHLLETKSPGIRVVTTFSRVCLMFTQTALQNSNS